MKAMSSWAATKHKTTNWSSYNDSLKRRGSLSIWFDSGMVWTPPPNGMRGRQQQFSDAAIQTCLTLKVLFGQPLGVRDTPQHWQGINAQRALISMGSTIRAAVTHRWAATAPWHSSERPHK
jgi:hypothetical protein